MTDAPVPDFSVHYDLIALPGLPVEGDGSYAINRLCVADDGKMVASAMVVLAGLTDAQAERLARSIASALGLGDVLAALDNRDRWRDLAAALNRHRDHEGVEVEVHDARRAPDPLPGGWDDVRDYLPEEYR